jgi:hypothetical protein
VPGSTAIERGRTNEAMNITEQNQEIKRNELELAAATQLATTLLWRNEVTEDKYGNPPVYFSKPEHIKRVVQIGEQFGYPRCCIWQFLLDTQVWMTHAVHCRERVSAADGRIMCDQCAAIEGHKAEIPW